MSELYDDLQIIYNKLNEKLAMLNNPNIGNADKARLIAWMNATLRELQVYVQALAENRLSPETTNQKL